MNQSNQPTWGLPEGHLQNQYKREVQVLPSVHHAENKTALNTANKAMSTLENIVNDLRVENERLKRDVVRITDINRGLEGALNQANTKIVDVEAKLSNALRSTIAVNIPKAGAKGDYFERYGGVGTARYDTNINACAEVPAPFPTRNTVAAAVATAYEAPVNPMTVFVEFLEELDILEEYIKESEYSFEELCEDLSPSEWIGSVMQKEDSYDLKDGWDEANDLWETICESDDLNSKEAYIE